MGGEGWIAGDPVALAVAPRRERRIPAHLSIDEMARHGLVRMWPRPPVPAISQIIAIAGQEVHDLLAGNKSIGSALRDAQNRSDRVMRELGYG